MITSIDEKRDLLCQAITNRKLVQFKYDGRTRIVEPFCCGAGAAGNYVLRGFQIRGSEKTKPMCWRLYELSEMSQLNITQHAFSGKRDEYQLNDLAITDIFCRV